MSEPKEIANAIDRLIRARIREAHLLRSDAFDYGCARTLQAKKDAQDAILELAGYLSH